MVAPSVSHPQSFGLSPAPRQLKEEADIAQTKGVDGYHVWATTRWFLCLAAGVIGSLIVHGLLVERVMVSPYGSDQFYATAFIVLCNRTVVATFGAVTCRIRGEPLVPSATLIKYGFVSLANFVASVCQYEALKWVSFSMQLLGKSFKMIPVMLWTMTMSGKKYTSSEWLMSLFISVGVSGFMIGGDISSPRIEEEWESIYGVALLVMFLVADSFTSTFQEKLFADHGVTKYNQMLYVNLCSSIISIVSLNVSGDFLPSLIFCTRHPEFPIDAAVLSFAAVVSQFFIVSMVKDFGALALAATMNVRQLLSIIISCVTYGHPITPVQVLCLFTVFATLLAKSSVGVVKKMREVRGGHGAQNEKQGLSAEIRLKGKARKTDARKAGNSELETIIGAADCGGLPTKPLQSHLTGTRKDSDLAKNYAHYVPNKEHNIIKDVECGETLLASLSSSSQLHVRTQTSGVDEEKDGKELHSLQVGIETAGESQQSITASATSKQALSPQP